MSDIRPSLTPQELEAYEKICLLPDLSARDYALRVTAHHHEWIEVATTEGVQGRGKSAKFLGLLAADFHELLVSRPPEDIEAAKQIFVGYAGRPKDEEGPGLGSDNDNRHSWLLKVRKLANFTGRLVDVEEAPKQPENATESVADPYLDQRFWREVYKEASSSVQAKEALRAYVMGPQIEDKDPAVLADVIDQINQQPEQAGNHMFNRQPDRLIREAYDTFKLLVGEANQAGWQNAAAVGKLINQLPNRDVPPHAVIIHSANSITRILNADSKASQRVALEMLDTRNLLHLKEAIDRCLHIIFEYGEQPKGHDPLNYMLTGQILGLMVNIADQKLRGRK